MRDYMGKAEWDDEVRAERRAHERRLPGYLTQQEEIERLAVRCAKAEKVCAEAGTRIATLEYELKAKTAECEIADGEIERLKAALSADGARVERLAALNDRVIDTLAICRKALEEIAQFQATEPWRLTAKAMKGTADRALEQAYGDFSDPVFDERHRALASCDQQPKAEDPKRLSPKGASAVGCEAGETPIPPLTETPPHD